MNSTDECEIQVETVPSTSENENSSDNTTQTLARQIAISQVVQDVSDTLSLSTISDISDGNNDVCCVVRNYDNRLHLMSNVNSVENIAASHGNIGSIEIQSSSDISFGNKTFFNGPVVIKNFVVDKENTFVNATEINSEEPETTTIQQTSDKKKLCPLIRYYLNNRLILISLIVTSAVLVISSFIVGGYFLNMQDNLPNETLNSTPTSTSSSAAPLTTEQTTKTPTEPTTVPVDVYDFEFINRLQYGALLPRKELPLNLFVKRVIIGHTAKESCTSLEECSEIVLKIQYLHMTYYRYDDIGYNFLVGEDGRAYQGCDYNMGSHTLGQYQTSICIAFIGNFTVNEAPKQQLRAAQRLIEDGIKLNKIHVEYALYGQRQLSDSQNLSPGTALYNQIMLWPHWSKDIIPM